MINIIDYKIIDGQTLINKIEINRKRDGEVLNYFHATGWRICIIWECSIRGKSQLSNIDKTINKISKWLTSKRIWIEITSDKYNKNI